MEMLYCTLQGITYYKPICRVTEEEQGEKLPKTSLFHPTAQFFRKEETLLTPPPSEIK